YVRQAAAVSLGNIGPEAKEAVPYLIEALKDVRLAAAAAEVLGNIGPEAKEAVPYLIEALKDESLYVRLAAAEALGNIGPEAKEAVPYLIEALKDESLYVRRAAAVSLGNIGPEAKEAVPYLIEALKDESLYVRLAALEALDKIGPEAKKVIIKTSKNKSRDVGGDVSDETRKYISKKELRQQILSIQRQQIEEMITLLLDLTNDYRRERNAQHDVADKVLAIKAKQKYIIKVLGEIGIVSPSLVVKCLEEAIKKETDRDKEDALRRILAKIQMQRAVSFEMLKSEDLFKKLSTDIEDSVNGMVLFDILIGPGENISFACAPYISKRNLEIIEEFADPSDTIRRIMSNPSSGVHTRNIDVPEMEAEYRASKEILRELGFSQTRKREKRDRDVWRLGRKFYVDGRDTLENNPIAGSWLRGTLKGKLLSAKGFIRLDEPTEKENFLRQKSNEITEEDESNYERLLIGEFIEVIHLLSRGVNPDKELILKPSIRKLFASRGIKLPGSIILGDFVKITSSSDVEISIQPVAPQKKPKEEIVSSKEILTRNHARYPVTITNRLGLHLRVAAIIVDLVRNSKSSVTITKGAQIANATSLEALVKLVAEEGDRLIIEAKGEDAMDVAMKIEEILKDESLLTNLGLGSPSECLKTLYDEFKDTQVHIKDLIKQRIKSKGGHFSKTTVYVELKELIKLGLVRRVESKRGYYELTNFARRLTPRQLDFIYDIPELKRYKMRRGKVASSRREIYNNIQDFSRLKNRIVFFLGDEVKSDISAFTLALQQLRSNNIPIVLVIDEEYKEKLTRQIYGDVTLKALLRRLKLKVMTFEEVGIDPAKVDSYKMQILGIDDIHSIPLTPLKLNLHPELKEVRTRV
ncbi:MAG: HPr family phosphocarrier protein, partial [Nanoarchaeota archaeon]|nr:HPr family phosphocarrier protein [Nanoarchaeota archaeon]